MGCLALEFEFNSSEGHFLRHSSWACRLPPYYLMLVAFLSVLGAQFRLLARVRRPLSYQKSFDYGLEWHLLLLKDHFSCSLLIILANLQNLRTGPNNLRSQLISDTTWHRSYWLVVLATWAKKNWLNRSLRLLFSLVLILISRKDRRLNSLHLELWYFCWLVFDEMLVVSAFCDWVRTRFYLDRCPFGTQVVSWQIDM